VIKQRKDINTLSAGELSDYIHALDILRARSEIDEDDPTGYAFQAALHNDGFVGPCEHGNDQFLPWHRAHLYYFEQLLQGADPPRTANVTIPYWDWLHRETSGKFPAAFGGPGLFKPGRNVVAADLPPDTLIIVTGEMDWNEFGGYPKGSPTGDYGRLEDGPHNDMHGSYIGGDMASPNLAARDAIYFSFHGFIDLMWSEWQQRNGMPPPTSPTADLRGFLTQTLHKVQDFQRTTGLGYEYEYTDQLKAAFAVTVPAPVKRSLVGTERLRSLSEGGLEADLQEKEWTQFAFPPVSERAMATMVRLQDLRVPRGGSYKLNVYVPPQQRALHQGRVVRRPLLRRLRRPVADAPWARGAR